MRLEELYLHDILEAVEAIGEIVDELNYERFVASRRDRSAVLHELMIIGESAAHISVELRARYPHVSWTEMSGARNVIVHGYFGLDWERIWQTITHNVPPLREQITAILEAEFPDSASRD